MSTSILSEARRAFHAALLQGVLSTSAAGVPSNADKHSRQSVVLANGVLARLEGEAALGSRLAGQVSGAGFERACADFLALTFRHLTHLRPGTWEVGRDRIASRLAIAQFQQYEHLAALDALATHNPELAAALGLDYLIKPDIVVVRHPEPDGVINASALLVDADVATLSGLRRRNHAGLILHASVSCKWTLRSDRAQNARSEGLNLVRNRKGRLPHVVVVTGEPTPNRIASIALGTGDIDCVYHVALPELVEAAATLGFDDASEMLATMISGQRLRDIADLPLDLVI